MASIYRTKTYKFSQDGFNKCMRDIKARNKAFNVKDDMLWCLGMGILFMIGVVGSEWILKYYLGVGVSRIVRIIMNL